MPVVMVDVLVGGASGASPHRCMLSNVSYNFSARARTKAPVAFGRVNVHV